MAVRRARPTPLQEASGCGASSGCARKKTTTSSYGTSPIFKARCTRWLGSLQSTWTAETLISAVGCPSRNSIARASPFQNDRHAVKRINMPPCGLAWFQQHSPDKSRASVMKYFLDHAASPEQFSRSALRSGCRLNECHRPRFIIHLVAVNRVTEQNRAHR